MKAYLVTYNLMILLHNDQTFLASNQLSDLLSVDFIKQNYFIIIKYMLKTIYNTNNIKIMI